MYYNYYWNSCEFLCPLNFLAIVFNLFPNRQPGRASSLCLWFFVVLWNFVFFGKSRRVHENLNHWMCNFRNNILNNFRSLCALYLVPFRLAVMCVCVFIIIKFFICRIDVWMAFVDNDFYRSDIFFLFFKRFSVMPAWSPETWEFFIALQMWKIKSNNIQEIFTYFTLCQ